jgi:S1-C subfamily serine protease
VESDDEHDEDAPGAPLLPPDDRLWRHPSELSNSRSGGTRLAVPRIWTIAVLAGTVGVLLGTGVSYLAARTQVETRTVVVPAVERESDVVTVMAAGGKSQAAPDVVAVTQRIDPAIVHLTGKSGASTVDGSAVLFRSDGFMLTSADGLAGATTLTAVLADGRRRPARVVGVEPESGTAVVKMEGSGYPVAALGTTSTLTNGTPVVAVSATPLVAGGPAVAVGTVINQARTVNIGGGRQRIGMIETDAPIALSGWGGALLAGNGVVVGITGPGTSASGSHFATPIELAGAVARQLMGGGRVAFPWIGIQGDDLDPALASKLGVGGGALVDDVADLSPAAACGIRAGDVITAINGRLVLSMGALMMLLRTHVPGDEVLLQVRRGVDEQLLRVKLGTRPSSA